jgi:TolA-binding protein
VSATVSHRPGAIEDEQLLALARALPEPVFSETRREEMRTAFLSTVRGLRSESGAQAVLSFRRRLVHIGVLVVGCASAAAAAWRIAAPVSNQRRAPSPTPAVATPDGQRPAKIEPPRIETAAAAEKAREPTAAPRHMRKLSLGDRAHHLTPERSDTDVQIAFARGWSALRTGDFTSAAEAFRRAAVGNGNVLAEDALFWRGIALDRGGRSGPARVALSDFLARYPQSDHRAEASVILGWLLVHAGEIDEAVDRFEDALQDPAERVRNSARAGLAGARSAGESQR